VTVQSQSRGGEGPDLTNRLYRLNARASRSKGNSDKLWYA